MSDKQDLALIWSLAHPPDLYVSRNCGRHRLNAVSISTDHPHCGPAICGKDGAREGNKTYARRMVIGDGIAPCKQCKRRCELHEGLRVHLQGSGELGAIG